MSLLSAIMGIIPSKGDGAFLRLRLEDNLLRAEVEDSAIRVVIAERREGIAGDGTPVLLLKRQAEMVAQAESLRLEGGLLVARLPGGGLIQLKPGIDQWPEEPAAPTGGAVFPASLTTSALLQALALEGMASKEEYRAIFRGIQFEFRPGTLRAVASDGYVLAMLDLPADYRGEERKVVIPAWTVGHLRRVLQASRAEQVDVAPAEGHLWISAEGVHAELSALEGTFPEYERAIPPRDRPHTTATILDPGEAARILQAAMGLADPQNAAGILQPGPRWTVRVEGDYGMGEWPLPIEGGEPLDTPWFNLRYLTRILGLFKRGPVQWTLFYEEKNGTPRMEIPTVLEGGWDGIVAKAVIVPLRRP